MSTAGQNKIIKKQFIERKEQSAANSAVSNGQGAERAGWTGKAQGTCSRQCVKKGKCGLGMYQELFTIC